ncbi:globin domain-containing protein [Risungbinella massiliensis]|uniref:globin domain-containing protein n=1 Tax=Risungbinella massiliensis TaxID=1329796 RepID=UPI0005CB95DA|nr:globin [Risungbinella massiliensis]
MEAKTHYEQLGGEATIKKLVDIFYDLVKQNPILSPMFPEDMTETRENQYMFLTQYFGGPPLYSEKKGHPMLRARHMRFDITREKAEAWLSCMEQALDKVGVEGTLREEIWGRLVYTAYHMQNQ